MLNVIGVVILTALTVLFALLAVFNLQRASEAAAFGVRGVFTPIPAILALICFVLALIVGAA